MRQRRPAVIVVFLGVSVGATAFAVSAPSRPFTLSATRACLQGLPDSVVGLPPAMPPRASALFVYSFRRDRLPAQALGELGAWRGNGRQRYSGLTLTFFENGARARAGAMKTLMPLYGGKIQRNVVVAWDQAAAPPPRLRTSVLGCLRVEPGGTTSTRPTPHAALATFVGEWGGHTRRLEIGKGGGASEAVDSGCCVRVYRLTFQILSVSGTVTRATASYRLTSLKRFDSTVPRLRVGQRGKLLLRNGIVTNTLTRVFYCSDPAWSATGVCGA